MAGGEASLGPAPPPLLAFMAQQGWAPHAVRRHWTAHCAAPAIHLFTALPPALRDALREAIDAAQLCSDCAAACTAAVPNSEFSLPAEDECGMAMAAAE